MLTQVLWENWRRDTKGFKIRLSVGGGLEAEDDSDDDSGGIIF